MSAVEDNDDARSKVEEGRSGFTHPRGTGGGRRRIGALRNREEEVGEGEGQSTATRFRGRDVGHLEKRSLRLLGRRRRLRALPGWAMEVTERVSVP